VSEVVELLRRLVGIDSVNPDLVPGGAGEGEIAGFVAEWLERAGLEVTVEEAAPGRPNVVGVARGSGGGRSLMLNAHIDTVGYAGMERPLDAVVEGGRLYGRGAWDMKGSLAAMMLAGARAVGRLRGNLIVTAVVDEEYASIGTQAIVRDWTADAAIVTEPTELEVAVAHKGFVWLDVETRGTAAHGSRPDLGVDAIAKIGRDLVGLEELDGALRAGPGHSRLGPGSIHASLIEGGTELSTYPERCLLRVERRTVPGETPEVVEAQVREILDRASVADPGLQASLTMGMVRDPFEVGEDEEIVALVRREAARMLGREPTIAAEHGWMDSALLAAAGIPTVIFGPGGAGAHAVVEWVDLADVETCAAFYLAVAEAFCG